MESEGARAAAGLFEVDVVAVVVHERGAEDDHLDIAGVGLVDLQAVAVDGVRDGAPASTTVRSLENDVARAALVGLDAIGAVRLVRRTTGHEGDAVLAPLVDPQPS